MYSTMAHYVAKKLKFRPSEILDNWGVAELIVAYGVYANEESYQNFLEWKNLDKDTKKKVGKPDEYRLWFYSPEDLEVDE